MKAIKTKVDLHGIKHEDVGNILAENLFWQKKENVEIITGNSEKMRNLVIGWLEQYDYDYIEKLTKIKEWIEVRFKSDRNYKYQDAYTSINESIEKLKENL